MTDTIKKTRKPRFFTSDNLIAQLERQPLEEKIRIYGLLKESIKNEQIRLNEQLALITENVK